MAHRLGLLPRLGERAARTAAGGAEALGGPVLALFGRGEVDLAHVARLDVLGLGHHLGVEDLEEEVRVVGAQLALGRRPEAALRHVRVEPLASGGQHVGSRVVSHLRHLPSQPKSLSFHLMVSSLRQTALQVEDTLRVLVAAHLLDPPVGVVAVVALGVARMEVGVVADGGRLGRAVVVGRAALGRAPAAHAHLVRAEVAAVSAGEVPLEEGVRRRMVVEAADAGRGAVDAVDREGVLVVRGVGVLLLGA